jgi:hypothetical protein
MSKLNVLLKRVELFEKLALFGRKEDFVKAAQDYSQPYEGYVPEGVGPRPEGYDHSESGILDGPVAPKQHPIDYSAKAESIANRLKQLSGKNYSMYSSEYDNAKNKLIPALKSLFSKISGEEVDAYETLIRKVESQFPTFTSDVGRQELAGPKVKNLPSTKTPNVWHSREDFEKAMGR